MKKYNITVKGITYEVLVEEVPMYGKTAARGFESSSSASSAFEGGAHGTLSITAPVPGTVLSINVKVGQTVKQGESLCTLESMKMENTIPAPRDAVVAEIHISKGNTVSSEDVLFTLR